MCCSMCYFVLFIFIGIDFTATSNRVQFYHTFSDSIVRDAQFTAANQAIYTFKNE